MLAIRLQRIGRTGHAMYRISVQEAQKNPSSGRVVAFVGTYDPHTKKSNVQVETAQKFLDNGAQPSPRVVKLLKEAGVKMPAWVKEFTADKSKSTRHAVKLRKNQPAVEEVETVAVVEEAIEAGGEDLLPETTETVEAEIVEETPVEVAEPTATVTEEPAEPEVAVEK